jgi:hypothetical protein
MMRVEKTRVEVNSKEEAQDKAYDFFQAEVEEEFAQEDIKLELIEENSGFLGIFGGSKIYQATLEIEEPGEDGEFELRVKDDGIFLTVFQATGAGEDVRLSAIEEVIGEKEIREVD